MIRISCTNCKTVLSIDDAFAGGVCRCQHCGTIQTVPAQSRDTAGAAAAGQAMGGSKSLYRAGARGAGASSGESGSGLDELAGIVASSGLQSTRLTRPAKSAGDQARKQNLMSLIVGATVLVAVLLVIIIILLSRNGNAPSQGSNPGNPSAGTYAGTDANAQVPANTPSFCGTPLQGNTVIYLLDCGSSSGTYLGDLKDAAVKSLQSLGPDRKFQILFWNNGTDGAYPQDTTTYASQENITAAQKAIEDVAPFGQSDIQAALKRAIAKKPDTLIVATGKGWDLDNAWLDAVMRIRGQSPVKIDTFSLLNNGESAPLKKLAAQTGGSYHELDAGQLNSFGQ